MEHEYMNKAHGRFEVLNSNLQEVGQIGFELGYSMENPKNLVMWEA